jgi:large-conductance mechanosensitive channel
MRSARVVAVITFIIVALVIFLLVKVTKKWGIDRSSKKQQCQYPLF